jgi:hypothetical protein
MRANNSSSASQCAALRQKLPATAPSHSLASEGLSQLGTADSKTNSLKDAENWHAEFEIIDSCQGLHTRRVGNRRALLKKIREPKICLRQNRRIVLELSMKSHTIPSEIKKACEIWNAFSEAFDSVLCGLSGHEKLRGGYAEMRSRQLTVNKEEKMVPGVGVEPT